MPVRKSEKNEDLLPGVVEVVAGFEIVSSIRCDVVPVTGTKLPDEFSLPVWVVDFSTNVGMNQEVVVGGEVRVGKDEFFITLVFS